MHMKWKWIKGKKAEFAHASEIRTEVFCTEQGFTVEIELDDIDNVAWHIIGYKDETPVCTARIFYDDKNEMHFGRLAVHKEFRGQKIGLAMVEEMVKKAKELKADFAVLNSQADKAVFYERAGFEKTGNTSLDEGVPHVEMRRML